MRVMNWKMRLNSYHHSWFPDRFFEQAQLRLLRHLCTSFFYQLKHIMQVLQYGDTVTRILQSSAPQVNRKFFLRDTDAGSCPEVMCV